MKTKSIGKESKSIEYGGQTIRRLRWMVFRVERQEKRMNQDRIILLKRSVFNFERRMCEEIARGEVLFSS